VNQDNQKDPIDK